MNALSANQWKAQNWHAPAHKQPVIFLNATSDTQKANHRCTLITMWPTTTEERGGRCSNIIKKGQAVLSIIMSLRPVCDEMSFVFFRELSLMYWRFGHSLDSSDLVSEKHFRGPCVAPSETFSPTMIWPDVTLQQDEHTSKNYLEDQRWRSETLRCMMTDNDNNNLTRIPYFKWWARFHIMSFKHPLGLWY